MKKNRPSTQAASTSPVTISRLALSICTHVVPFMPPISTYTIITMPTTAMTALWAARLVLGMPSSSAMRPPAPAICATR